MQWRRPAPRDRLAICVDSVAPDQARVQEEEVARDAVKAALLDVTKSPYWPPYEFQFELSPTVSVGCPRKSVLHKESDWDSKLVKYPSYEGVFLYVVPEADIERVFGSQRWGLLLAEHSCPTDDCTPLTDAVYVSRADIEDVRFLSRVIKTSLGLVGPDDPGVTDYSFD
jgi:hypothetical protein